MGGTWKTHSVSGKLILAKLNAGNLNNKMKSVGEKVELS